MAETQAPAVDERPDVDVIVIPKTATIEERVRALMGITNDAGEYVAGKLFSPPRPEESELLHHRARCAFIDAAALFGVPMLFNEMHKAEPNKVKVDGCLAMLRGAGIVVDSVPLSRRDRKKQRAEDLAAATESDDALKARLARKLRELREEGAAEYDRKSARR